MLLVFSTSNEEVFMQNTKIVIKVNCTLAILQLVQRPEAKQEELKKRREAALLLLVVLLTTFLGGNNFNRNINNESVDHNDHLDGTLFQ